MAFTACNSSVWSFVPSNISDSHGSRDSKYSNAVADGELSLHFCWSGVSWDVTNADRGSGNSVLSPTPVSTIDSLYRCLQLVYHISGRRQSALARPVGDEGMSVDTTIPRVDGACRARCSIKGMPFAIQSSGLG
jgi:hypothetical protein